MKKSFLVLARAATRPTPIVSRFSDPGDDEDDEEGDTDDEADED